MSWKRLVGMLLVVTLIVGSGAISALASVPGAEPRFALVLPSGEELDDAELEDVDGGNPILVGIGIGIGAWVAGKAADEFWDNVVSPVIEEKVWDPLREKGWIPSNNKNDFLCLP